MSEEFQDEETSIKAIYGDNVLERLSGEPLVCGIKFPYQPAVSVRIEFPHGYPDVPPSVLGTQSVGGGLAKGDGAYLVDLVRDVLAEIYIPGAPCIFDLVEEVNSRIEALGLGDNETAKDQSATSVNIIAEDEEESRSKPYPSNLPQQLSEEPPWTISDIISEKKSVFVARCAPVNTVDQATRYLNHLLTNDKKIARATHNITAWRIQGENGVQYQDCDDDGESAAGSRVLHLLELMKVWNVMLVVTRWYGGVQLGPDRFRIINQTARDALVKAGYSQDGEKKQDGRKGKK